MLAKCHILVLLFFVSVFFFADHAGDGETPPFMRVLEGPERSGSRQAVIVSAAGPAGVLELSAYSLVQEKWVEVFRTKDVAIGKNGFAHSGEKREGDGRTPSGIYGLPLAFGYAAAIDSKLPYRQALENDVWVDDSKSENYNRWCKKELASATSFELMKRKDDLYKLGIVIGYNTDPIVPGNGSAIFFHIWSGPGSNTSGCVATREEFLMQLLKWLDPAKNPRIVLG